MKKVTMTISYDEEKLAALKLYLEQKDTQVETELIKSLDTLYQKTVPAGVREFIELRSGNPEPLIPKVKKQWLSTKQKSEENEAPDNVG